MEIKIGCHVSAAGGLWNAPKNAHDLKCEAFQIFSRSPQGGPVKPIENEAVEKFKAAMKEYGFTEFVIHAPYVLNFGSGNPRTYHGSISIIRQELERGSLIGAEYVMFHTGSGKDLGREKAMKQAKEGIKKVLDGYTGSTKLLLENSAGAGEILGDTFEELAELSEPIKKHPAFGGFCYDTQHGFASGYDIRTPEAVKETFKQFDKILGLEHLAMFQINDSKTEFNSHKDRHDHIADGLIGPKGFEALIKYLKANSSKLKASSLLLILETEHDKVELDIKKLKDLRNKSVK
jgi:deoxyribonuclease IV